MHAVGTGWNDRLHPAILYDLHKRIGIITLIADNGFSREGIDQSFRLTNRRRSVPVKGRLSAAI